MFTRTASSKLSSSSSKAGGDSTTFAQQREAFDTGERQVIGKKVARYTYFGQSMSTALREELIQLYLEAQEHSRFGRMISMDQTYRQIIEKLRLLFNDYEINGPAFSHKEWFIQNLVKISYLNRGLVSFEEKQYLKAIETFSQLLELDPENSHALYYRGCAHLKLNHTPLAINDLTRLKDTDEHWTLLLSSGPDTALLDHPLNLVVYDEFSSSLKSAVEFQLARALKDWLKVTNLAPQYIESLAMSDAPNHKQILELFDARMTAAYAEKKRRRIIEAECYYQDALEGLGNNCQFQEEINSVVQCLDEIQQQKLTYQPRVKPQSSLSGVFSQFVGLQRRDTAGVSMSDKGARPVVTHAPPPARTHEQRMFKAAWPISNKKYAPVAGESTGTARSSTPTLGATGF